MWSAEGMDYFNKCKTNWDRMYDDEEQQEKLQAKWCEYMIKDQKPPLLNVALVDKKKTTSVHVQQEFVSGAPNMFIFPGDEGYEGDEHERLTCKSDAMLGPNEINEDLQQMGRGRL